MRYTVVVMPQAKRQALDINAWWQANRQEAPLRFAEDFELMLMGLEQNPNRGVRMGAAGGRRRLVTLRTKLLIVYRVRPLARRVEIVEIRRP